LYVMKKLRAEQKIQIRKPMAEVCEGITDPEQMSQYFIARSSGRLEEGSTVYWEFPEFPGTFPVTGKKMVINEYISFDWTGGEPGMLVEIFLTPMPDGSTLVRVVEGEKDNNEEGVSWLAGQTGGWANFLACMKAWLEYGINLRKGAFDFMRKPV